MQKPLPSWLAYLPAWLVVVSIDHEYRRLTVWSYTLMIRVRWMAWLAELSALLPTPVLVALLHRRAKALAIEIADLKRAVRARREANDMRSARSVAETFINPWA